MRDPATDPFGEEAEKLRLELAEEEQLVNDFQALKDKLSENLTYAMGAVGTLYLDESFWNVEHRRGSVYQSISDFVASYGWPCTFHCFAEAVKDEETFRKEAVDRR